MNTSQAIDIQGIPSALQAKGVSPTCPECGGQRSVMDWVQPLQMHQGEGVVMVPGRYMMCAVLGCNSCGHMSMFSVGHLLK